MADLDTQLKGVDAAAINAAISSAQSTATDAATAAGAAQAAATNAQTTATSADNKADTLAADIDAKVGDVKATQFNQSAGTTFTIYDGTDWILQWDAPSRQLKLTAKTGVGWFDVVVMKVDGNSTTFRVTADDISATANTAFFLTPSGTQNTNFNHENYGAFTKAHWRAESSNGKSYGRVECQTGNASFLAGEVKIYQEA